MSIKLAVVQASEPSSTGTQNYTVSGFGTPKAVIVIGTHNEDVYDTLSTEGASIGMGFSDGVLQQAITIAAKTGSATSASRRGAGDVLYYRADQDFSNNTDFLAVFDAWITDGVRLNWPIVTSGDVGKFMVILIGGDINAKVGVFTPNLTVDASTTITSLTSTPEVIFFLGAYRDFEASGSLSYDVDSCFGFGIATNHAGSFEQASCAIGQDHYVGSASCGQAQYNTRCYSALSAPDGEIEYNLELTNVTSSGFTVTTRENNDDIAEVAYLALNLSGSYYKLVHDQLSASLGTDTLPSGDALDFVPAYAVMGATINQSLNTYQQSDSCLGVGFDAEDSTGGMCSIMMMNALATTDTASVTSSGKLLYVSDPLGNDDKIAAISSWNDNTVTLNYTGTSSEDAWAFTLFMGEAMAEVSRKILIPSWLFQPKGGLL